MTGAFPLPYTVDAPDVQGNFDALAIAVGPLSSAQKIKAGVFSTWNWSGSYTTDLSIPHGLATTPSGALVSGVLRGSEMTTDARAPWLASVTGLDATNISVRVMTFNKAVIGAFAANEPIRWMAWR